jgi:hypothetical protein
MTNRALRRRIVRSVGDNQPRLRLDHLSGQLHADRGDEPLCAGSESNVPEMAPFTSNHSSRVFATILSTTARSILRLRPGHRGSACPD